MTRARADRRQETARLLGQLIACDTSNPPGRETRAAALLADYLGSAGVACELVAREPERANLVARVTGGSGPTLMFLGHTDVVPADQHGWTVPPFGGIERDGAIWGRGAVDMKCQLASAAVALAELARGGRKPGGDVLLVAAADEEVGDAQVGMPWLVEQRPEIRPDFAVGEGAGERFDVPSGPVYLVDRGVKQGVQVTMRVRGRAGDASLPGSGQDAVSTLAGLLARLPAFVGEPRLGPEAEGIAAAVAPGSGKPDERLERVRAANGSLGRILEALMRTTVVPTQARAAGPFNVVADVAEATLQCGLLPEDDVKNLLDQIRRELGEERYELEPGEPNGGSRSPVESLLRDAIDGFVAEHDPAARTVATLGYGYSDCHVLREAFGTIAYGFIPFRHAPPEQNLQGKHGPDEHVLIDDLEFQVEGALHIARRLGD
jgi:acetylornithine deacetylase/succinyl-diaminopimelate desuccinylase-like protein